MGIVIRQGLRGTIGTYIGVAIGAFNLLWLFPRLLTPTEIGLLRVLQDIAFLLAIVSQFGISSITDRFFPYFRNEKEKHNGFLFFILLYPLLGFILISFLFLLLSDYVQSFYETNSPALKDYLFYVIPLCFFILYQQVLEAYLRAHFLLSFPVVNREIFLRIFLGLIVVLYALDLFTIDGLVIALLFCYLSIVLILFLYIYKIRSLLLARFDFVKNRSMLKQMVVFGMFVFLMGVVAVFNTKIDVIMLSGMQDLGATGIYSIAFFIGTVIEIPRRAISAISLPVISDAWKKSDLNKIREMYWKSSLNLSIAGVLLFLLIYGNIDLIFNLIPNSEVYRAGVFVVLYIGLSRVVDMITGVNYELILTSPFYKLNFILGLFSGVLNVFLNYILIPKMGMEGAALATLLAISFANLIRMIVIWKKVQLQPFTFQNLHILALGGIFYVLLELLSVPVSDFLPSLIFLLLRGGITAILFLGILYILKVSHDFNATVKNLLSSILRRK